MKINKEKVKNIILLNKIPFGVCSVLILINIIFYLGYIGFQEKRISNLNLLYSNTRNYQHGTPDNEDALFAMAREDLQKFYKMLSPVSGFVEMVTDLKDKFQRSGVVISKMTFKPDHLEEHSIWKYTTSFTLSGRYGTLKEILADIYRSPNLFCIDRLAFYNDSDENEKVDLSLSITTYYNGKS